ncbi:MAG: putative NAD(P)H nitroreductase [Steroidobacteraceae bacterium]|nr:putative NAD(P)H nitroreductase [Steroidobacteraceae bacterium]
MRGYLPAEAGTPEVEPMIESSTRNVTAETKRMNAGVRSKERHSRAVSALWQHRPFDRAHVDPALLVHYATLAASSHNTQPWKFEAGRDRITILPDLTRRCPAVDPDDHHLFASLGCAAENLLQAARAMGLEGHVAYDATRSGVRIDFEPATPARSALFEAIPQRQCSRCAYDGSTLSANELRTLEATSRSAGTAVLWLTDPGSKERMAEYVAAGNTAQFVDRAWASELRSWIRFNAREALATGDGLYGPVMGSPDVPRWLGMLAMRFAFSSRAQNRKDIAHIRSSSAIVVIASGSDDREHWIDAGRCYERLALQAASMGLRTAFINQPVEVPALRSEFATFVGLGARRPDLVVRIGRGPQMPRSLRRPVSAVLA